VDDASRDGTAEMVREWMSRFPQIHLHVLAQHSGKKKALEMGLHRLDRELVLLTDADCLPASENWVSLMVDALDPTSDAVLGYSPYEHEEGRLNEVIRLETAYTAALYFGFARRKLAYMGVGRNLLYRRKALVNVFRPDAHLSLKSGDDDLTIQELSRKGKVNYRFDPPSWVYSQPEKNWKAWLDQKKRHVSTARHYRPLPQALLLMWYGSLAGTWIFGLLAAFHVPLILLLWMGLRGIGFGMVFHPMLDVFGVQLSFRKWLSAEGIYVAALLYLFPFSTFKKWDKW
jgi:glycosyltransferase involved in cell wall biosynthesis